MKITLTDPRTSVTLQPRNFTVTLSGARGPAGQGLPAGGAEGQIIVKQSATDYDTAWADNYATNVELYVKNSTAGAMTKGQVVYVSGADGNNPTVTLAQATSEGGSSKTIGVLKQDLAVGASGYVITDGLLEGLNTNSATAAGDTIWLSPTTAGGVVYGTANKPSAPNHMVFIGYVLRKNTNNGKIFVKIQNGFELQELHNVAISNPVTGQVLKYNATTGLWSNDTDAGGINTLNGLTTSSQSFATGTSGTDFAISSSTSTHTFNIPTASASARGLLSSTDWSTFNGKQGALSFDLTPTNGSTNPVTSDGVFDALALKQDNITLTTTGTTGSATFIGATLNIPQYQSALTNPVTGTGTSGQVAYFNGTSAVTGSANLFWDNANGRLGIGTNTPTSRLHLVQTDTGTSTLIGYQNSITSTPTANKSTATYGASFETTIAGTFQSTNVLSFQARVNVTSNNVNNQVRGLLGRVTTSSTGNAFSAIGLQTLIEHNSTGTITSAYGLSISNIVNNGTITNTYGIYIGDMTTGTQTNTPYAIYSEDASAISYLAGSTSIGTTTSSARLHVRGSGTTSATTALLVQNSTPTDLFVVRDDGIVRARGSYLNLGTDQNVAIGPTTTGTAFNSSGADLLFAGSNAGSTNSCAYFSISGGNKTGTSGIQGSFAIVGGNFAPTSGTAQFRCIDITSNVTINQTGGANGITRGLYVNPTLTAAADWRGIESVAASNANHTLLKLRNATVDVLTVKADSKIGFWNATPVAQPTTAIAEATFTENSGGTAVNVDSTFAGYTLQQIAQALKDIGILQ